MRSHWLRILLISGLLLWCASNMAQAQIIINIPDEPPEWDGQSRFTVAVLGLDRRPDQDGLTVRTDAVMVVSYDPLTDRIGVLDIPRDMHFVMGNPGQLVPINSVVLRGELIRENFGPYLMMETLQNNLGMYIDAYVAFDFTAFITFVDSIGGLTIDVPVPIYDATSPDLAYGYDPLYLQRGVQQMDGYTALRYARTRHQDDDYQRGERQLAVIAAVRDKLADADTLQNLIRNTPMLLNTLEDHFYTNLTPEQLLFLGVSVMRSDNATLTTGSLSRAYSFAYDDQRIPDRARLPQLLTEIFGADYNS